MNKVIKNKRGLELVNVGSSACETIPLFIIYYLTKFDDVM